MRIKTQQHSDGALYTAAAAASLVGQTAPVTLEGRPGGEGTVVAAVVLDDGHVLELTIDLHESPGSAALVRALGPVISPFSIGTGPGAGRAGAPRP